MTRSLRRQESAYEDRAREIQKHINACREAYRDAMDFIEDFPPTASDTTERTAELVKHCTPTPGGILEEWDCLADSYDIPDGDSEWASHMRDDHDRFLAQAPNLSADLRQLITTYRDYLEQTQRLADTLSPLPPSSELGLGVQPTMPAPSRTSRKAPATAARLTGTIASNGTNGQVQQGDAFGPADNAGEDHSLDPPEEQQPTAAHDATPEAQQHRNVHFREEPDEVHELRDLSLRSEDDDSDLEYHEAPLGPPIRRTGAHDRRTEQTPQASRHSSPLAACRPRPLYYGNSSMCGLCAHSDGLLSEARPMVGQNAHAD
ncbi:hypothetical protein AAVH_11987 [Aphelenchoides avenae]|nr:hypothetical protein AAVH_11987 [Aphelenchus avenae]